MQSFRLELVRLRNESSLHPTHRQTILQIRLKWSCNTYQIALYCDNQGLNYAIISHTLGFQLEDIVLYILHVFA